MFRHEKIVELGAESRDITCQYLYIDFSVNKVTFIPRLFIKKESLAKFEHHHTQKHGDCGTRRF